MVTNKPFTIPSGVLDDAATLHLLSDAMDDKNYVVDVWRFITGCGINTVATMNTITSCEKERV